jgi:hypothetical protein
MPSDLKVVSAVPDKPAKKACGTVLDGIGQQFLDRQGRAGTWQAADQVATMLAMP